MTFKDAYGTIFDKPESIACVDRFSIYSLIFIKDINKFVFIIPDYAVGTNFYKCAGGGIEEGEDLLYALNRELIEEINYPLNQNFKLEYNMSYDFLFKPIGKPNAYWNNKQTFFYYTVDKLDQTNYPKDNWISTLEATDVVYLDPSFVFNNLNCFHSTIVDFLKEIQQLFFNQ